MIALTFHLGQWQQRRAAEKDALQADFDQRRALPEIVVDAGRRDAEALRYRSVRVHGAWKRGGEIYLDNKFHDNTVGYYVVTPLQLAGSDAYVLVNRGWIARGAAYPKPPVAPPPAEGEVVGIATIPTQRFLELSAASVEGTVWQNLTIDRYRSQSGLDVLPYVILAREASAGLLPVSEQPDAGAAKHIEYMLTWYSLAATTLVLWIALNLKIRRQPAAAGGKPQ
ncbi:MAG: SURF1 family protein [Betaproteobacteria bacterium]|nr:SURF1 family protein [Betaproteobacteria bacterium]